MLKKDRYHTQHGTPVKEGATAMLVIPQRFDEILNTVKRELPMTRNELLTHLVRDLSEADIKKIKRKHAAHKLNVATRKLAEIVEWGGNAQSASDQRRRIKAYSKLIG